MHGDIFYIQYILILTQYSSSYSQYWQIKSDGLLQKRINSWKWEQYHSRIEDNQYLVSSWQFVLLYMHFKTYDKANLWVKSARLPELFCLNK